MVAAAHLAGHTRSGCWPLPGSQERPGERAVMAFRPEKWRRRARRWFAYLRSERRTLRQGFVALLLGALTSFVAGITLANITGTLRELPGLLILTPAVLGMRGTIFGAIGARLGTATHAGLFEVSRDRAGVMRQN